MRSLDRLVCDTSLSLNIAGGLGDSGCGIVANLATAAAIQDRLAVNERDWIKIKGSRYTNW